MALTDFKPFFDNTYETVFNKVLVGLDIANLRFKPVLTYGESVERVAYDTSSVRVRDVVRGAVSTIDTLTDSSETLLINIEKEAAFHISRGEEKQAGPLNPGEVIGGSIAKKVAADLDARIFAEVLNAYQTFDTGDLTTLTSTGVPITLSSTTVPQMVTRMPAKLRKGANQTVSAGNMAFVIDSYGAGDIEQYLLGKQFSIVESVFKNGYAGLISSAQVYVSENLTSTALYTDAGIADGETFTINGVVFTFKTALSSGPAVAGEILIGVSNTTAITNAVALINTPGTTTVQGTALSAADQILLTDTYKVSAVVTTADSAFTITAIGAGRLTLSDTAGSGAWTNNMIHCYYGKKGGIDVVVQNLEPVEMIPTSDKRGTNIFSSYMAGIKTFADGAKQFLDVKVAAY